MLEGDSLNSEALLEHLHHLLQHEGERRAMGQAAAELCPADAARRMAELIFSHALSAKGPERKSERESERGAVKQ
jgi:UDP-N-acetylglucosamine:LPS N-acetylglucosamine transferase